MMRAIMQEDRISLTDILDAPTEGPSRDEKGRFAPKEPQEPEESAQPETGEQAPAPEPEAASVPPTPETQPEPEPERIPFAALKDERAKRQQLEAEIAHLRATLQQQAQPQQQFQTLPAQQQEAPDMFADPEGYQAWVMAQAEQIAYAKAVEVQRMERVRLSNASAMQKYADYGEVIEQFKQMAQLNPMLEQTMLEQPDPADWAYKTAKTHLEVQNYGSLDALVAAKVAEAQKAAIAQLEAKAKPSIPETIADARNVGQRSGPAWSGPQSLADILNR